MNFHTRPRAYRGAIETTRRGAVRFEALDSWRGIAAIFVVLFHAQIISHVHEWPLVRSGEAMVDFFFVLSGFVVTHAYLDRLHDSRGLGKFLVTRLGRLYPLHLFMFLLFLAFESAKAGVPGLTNPADPAFSGSNAPWTMVSNLLLLHALRFDDVLSWNTPSWSISAEWLCYICFGLAVVNQRRRLTWLLAGTVTAAPVLVFAFAPAGMETTADLGAVRALFSFAAGALLYVLLGKRILRAHASAVPKHLARESLPIWSIAEVSVVLLAAWMTVHARETSFGYLTPLVFAAMVGIFAVERGMVSRALKHRAMLFLGAISYSIYMTHLFVQLRFMNFARLSDRLFGTESVLQVGRTAQYGGGIDPGNLYAGDLLMGCMVAVTIAVSILTYRWIEQPGIRASRRLAKRLFD